MLRIAALCRRAGVGPARCDARPAWLGMLLLAAFTSDVLALDINSLWDYSSPEISERRFVAALDGASKNEQLILQTQIARSHGLRRDFAKARQVLASVEPELAKASPEVQVRYHLELGRSFVSATHPAAERTPLHIERGRSGFLRAHELAAAAGLDSLAVDALHMMAFVDTDADLQLEWNKKALAAMERSDQADAKRWEGSLRNNVGHALRLKGEFEAALAEFRLSRAAYQRAGRTRNVRIADWMIARTYRDQQRHDDALAIQLELERQWDADGRPDPYVYEELEWLYRAVGDPARAAAYRDKLKAAPR